jgi:hypothetical protein
MSLFMSTKIPKDCEKCRIFRDDADMMCIIQYPNSEGVSVPTLSQLRREFKTMKDFEKFIQEGFKAKALDGNESTNGRYMIRGGILFSEWMCDGSKIRQLSFSRKTAIKLGILT